MERSDWIDTKVLHAVQDLLATGSPSERDIAGAVMGALLSELPFRFSKSYRHGAILAHARVYAAIPTAAVNLLADTLRCVDSEVRMEPPSQAHDHGTSRHERGKHHPWEPSDDV